MSEEAQITDQEQEKEYTPEELKQMRANTIEYYKNQNQVLRLQVEFEELQARIAEAQSKTMMHRIRMAQMAMGPPKETPKDNPDTEDKK